MQVLHVGEKKPGGILDDSYRTYEERGLELKKMDEQDEAKRREQMKSPFSNWYQFNRNHTKDVIWLATKYPKAQAVLFFLLDQMDEYNAVLCSYQVLQEALEVGRATVQRSISVLKEKGFISIYKSGTSNVYVVNDDLAWSSWGNNRRYSKFPANVILSASEQEQTGTKIEKAKVKHISIKDNE